MAAAAFAEYADAMNAALVADEYPAESDANLAAIAARRAGARTELNESFYSDYAAGAPYSEDAKAGFVKAHVELIGKINARHPQMASRLADAVHGVAKLDNGSLFSFREELLRA